MTPVTHSELSIRQFQYRDLEAIEQLLVATFEADGNSRSLDVGHQIDRLRQWYAPLKLLSLFPNRLQHWFRVYVAEQAGKLLGMIQVSPFNSAHSTWRIDYVAVDVAAGKQDVGSQLLSHCFKTILEARFWLLEVNVNNKDALGLYRQNGFQPLAQITYWSVAPAQLQELAQRQPELPNLLPISNADTALLYQLDTAAMPPLVRQVFDRSTQDFKRGVLTSLSEGLRQWVSHTSFAKGYVFEPQRKAAIGYFQVRLSSPGNQPHVAQLTVHPAYTWLYPELLAQMAQLTAQDLPPQPLQLTSADYQPEREEYLEQIGAERIEHTLMMSRSVWHKLRESKHFSLESLQLSEVLQGFQPGRKAVPGRLSLLKPVPPYRQLEEQGRRGETPRQWSPNGRSASPEDTSDQEG